MKITILSTAVNEKKWQKGERSGVIRTQEAIAECDRFRGVIRLDLGKNDPHPAGEYTLDLEHAVSIGDFGDFKFRRDLPLVPVAKPAAARAA